MEPISLALGLAQVVPTIAGWFGGSDAEATATSVINIAKTVTGVSNPTEAVEMVATDSNAQLRFQQALLAYQESMFRAELADVDSARKREMAVQDITPRVLALVVTVGFFGLLGFLVFHEAPAGSRDILNIMIGALGAGFGSVLGYYFGSSQTGDKLKALPR